MQRSQYAPLILIKSGRELHRERESVREQCANYNRALSLSHFRLSSLALLVDARVVCFAVFAVNRKASKILWVTPRQPQRQRKKKNVNKACARNARTQWGRMDRRPGDGGRRTQSRVFLLLILQTVYRVWDNRKYSPRND